MRPRSRRPALGAVCLAAALVAAGCGPDARARVGHYVEPGGAILRLGRVVLIPLANETDYADIEDGMTQELFQAVQGRQLFHLDALPPDSQEADPGSRPGAKVFTLRDLAEMRRSFGCDAVLVGAIRHFQPHPRMQLGLYLRLLDLRSGRLLWGVDHAWDSTDRETQQRMEAFFERHVGTGANPLAWRLAAVSPRLFQKFVAWEAAETLPRRPPAPR